MSLARIKVWNSGDVLNAADLNAEYNNILNNPATLIFPSTASENHNNQQMLSMRLENVSADPAIGNVGRVWFNTTQNYVGLDNGVAVSQLGPQMTGQCRLVYVTSSQIQLQPYQGNRIPVVSSSGAWAMMTVPSTGIALSSTTFTNLSSMNYIYASGTSGGPTPILGAVTSSVGHQASTAVGVEIVTTSNSGLGAPYTLVGFIQTSTANAGFYSTGGLANLVASWFNRQPVSQFTAASTTGNQTITSTAWAALAGAFSQNFPMWSDDRALVGVQGLFNSTGSNGGIFMGPIVDSSAMPGVWAFIASNTPGNFPFTCLGPVTSSVAEGVHTVAVGGVNSTAGVTNVVSVSTSIFPTPVPLVTCSVRV